MFSLLKKTTEISGPDAGPGAVLSELWKLLHHGQNRDEIRETIQLMEGKLYGKMQGIFTV